MAYASITLVASKAALAARLGNPTKTFWVDAELGRLLAEAQRTFNALTGFWRARDVFAADPAKRFYDLSVEMPDQLGYTVTDRDLVTDIQYALMEPATPTVWTGSEQFTLADVTAAIQRRLNQFLVDTGMVVKARTVPLVGAPGTRSPLPAAIIDLRRVAWAGIDGNERVLNREDEFAFTTFSPSWNLSPKPKPQAYSVGATPPLSIRIAPAPLDTGELHVLAVEVGPTLDPVTGVILGMPDDWTWVVKFGALADLLQQDGLATDVARAQYCEQRYREGVGLAVVAPGPVMAGTINDVELTINTVSDADRYLVGWMNNTTRPPKLLAMAAQNVMAVVPRAPASGSFGVSLDVIRRMPVDGTYLQIPDEAYDAVLDLAEHLGTFKLGGDEFARSSVLLDRFYKYCGVDLSRFRASVPNLDALTNAVERNDAVNPRLNEPSQVVGLG